ELPAFQPPLEHARSRSIATAGAVRVDSWRHARNAMMESAVGATQLTVSGTHGHPDFKGSKRTCLSSSRNFHCHSQWDSTPRRSDSHSNARAAAPLTAVV